MVGSPSHSLTVFTYLVSLPLVVFSLRSTPHVVTGTQKLKYSKGYASSGAATPWSISASQYSSHYMSIVCMNSKHNTKHNIISSREPSYLTNTKSVSLVSITGSDSRSENQQNCLLYHNMHGCLATLVYKSQTLFPPYLLFLPFIAPA